MRKNSNFRKKAAAGRRPFSMSNKIKLLLTKKELELAQGSSAKVLRTHSPHRLKQYIKLVRKLRDKYRDLTQRQRSELKKAQRNSQSQRTLEKARIFSKVLAAFEQQSKSIQNKSDHEQHYDLDGVTRLHGKIIIPSGVQVNKESYDLLTDSQ